MWRAGSTVPGAGGGADATRPCWYRRSVFVRLAMSVVAVAFAGAGVAAAQGTGEGSAGTGTAVPGTPAGVAPGRSTPPGPPKGTRGQQTHPRLVPRRARRTSRVAVHFTLADQPGHSGVVATDYRVQVDPPAGSRPACRGMAPATVDAGTRGAVVRVPLARPPHGWCVGRYIVTVFLQRGPYCPAPAPDQPPQPCPQFASQDLDVGRAGLTVRRPSRRGAHEQRRSMRR